MCYNFDALLSKTNLTSHLVDFHVEIYTKLGTNLEQKRNMGQKNECFYFEMFKNSLKPFLKSLVWNWK